MRLVCAAWSRRRDVPTNVAAIVTAVIEIRDDVKWLKRAVGALLTDRNLTVREDDESEDEN